MSQSIDNYCTSDEDMITDKKNSDVQNEKKKKDHSKVLFINKVLPGIFLSILCNNLLPKPLPAL